MALPLTDIIKIGVQTHSTASSAIATRVPSGGVEGFALGNRRTSQVPTGSQGFQGHITEFRIRQTTGRHFNTVGNSNSTNRNRF